MLAVCLVVSTTAWSAPQAALSRRAVFGGLASVSAAPLPAFARSKDEAKKKAVMKETAAEARQAMKEYKFAPRPELVGSVETGYTYKADTIKAGSQGEAASFFTAKGNTEEFRTRVDPTAAYKASKGEAVTTSKPAAKPAAKQVSDDEKRINEALKKFEGQKDDMGRLIGYDASSAPKSAATAQVTLDDDEQALMDALTKKKTKKK